MNEIIKCTKCLTEKENKYQLSCKKCFTLFPQCDLQGVESDEKDNVIDEITLHKETKTPQNNNTKIIRCRCRAPKRCKLCDEFKFCKNAFFDDIIEPNCESFKCNSCEKCCSCFHCDKYSIENILEKRKKNKNINFSELYKTEKEKIQRKHEKQSFNNDSTFYRKTLCLLLIISIFFVGRLIYMGNMDSEIRSDRYNRTLIIIDELTGETVKTLDVESVNEFLEKLEHFE